MLYTAPDILRRHRGGSIAGKAAIVDGPRRLTYAELAEQSLGYAALLTERGLAPGDRVAVFLRRSAEAVIALLATHLAGGVAVVIDDVLRTRQVNYILEHSQAAWLITDGRQRLYAPGLAIDAARIIDIDETNAPLREGPPPPTIGADLALLIYTSGSTGLPKGVMVSHANLVGGAEIVAEYLRLSERDVLISLLPFSFDYGLNQLLTALLVGATLVIQRSLFPADICATLEREKVTGMAGVPTLWLQLTDDRRSPFTRRAFPDLRYITNSGGRLPEPTVRLIRKTHPHVDVYLMYGLTEAFRSTYLPPAQVDERPTSIGRAIPNVEILVVGEGGRLCGVDEVGELVHRGPTTALGYWRDPEGTARVFRPHPVPPAPGGWIETVVFSGDLVTRDADGYLYFVGRRDQLIKRQGHRVSPDEVEQCLHASGLVANVVVFAVPANEVEDEIVVAVTPRHPATFHEDLLREFRTFARA
jgi:amino acid adenylation domain-containing protein